MSANCGDEDCPESCDVVASAHAQFGIDDIIPVMCKAPAANDGDVYAYGVRALTFYANEPSTRHRGARPRMGVA
jgi:hypothetical protein